MSSLKDGLLSPVVERVKKDHTLDFQIREEEVHVYYRGGRILGLKPAPCEKEGFNCSFDKKYFDNSEFPAGIEAPPERVTSRSDIDAWISILPHLKQAMDFHHVGTEKNEREFQQLICRENNYANVSNDTDYFIVDCEYVNPKFPGRLDLVAFKWRSTGIARKKGAVCLSFIEVKYADNALANTSGLREHVTQISKMAKDPEALEDIKQEMLEVFRQKRDLGLVRFGRGGNNNEVDSFEEGTPEILLMLINHKPTSSKLLSELDKLSDEQKAMVKIVTANFLGYGLYEKCVFSHADFIERYSKQLHT